MNALEKNSENRNEIIQGGRHAFYKFGGSKSAHDRLCLNARLLWYGPVVGMGHDHCQGAPAQDGQLPASASNGVGLKYTIKIIIDYHKPHKRYRVALTKCTYVLPLLQVVWSSTPHPRVLNICK